MTAAAEAEATNIPTLTVYPVDMQTHIVTQEFGENPQDYDQFGLKGHNGRDFAPVGGHPREIFAVDDGVIELRPDDPGGYGKHFYIVHAWGKSHYAHCSQIYVKNGQKVSAGRVVGLEGSTGNSSGVHLHFEIRPNGVSSKNGYSGAVDPRRAYASVQPPTTKPPKPPKPPQPVKAGLVRVTAPAGLNLRLAPDFPTGTPVGYAPAGTILEVTDVRAEDPADGIVFRQVVLWVAEQQGGAVLLENSSAK